MPAASSASRKASAPNAKFGLLLLALALISGSAIGYVFGRSSVTPVIFEYPEGVGEKSRAPATAKRTEAPSPAPEAHSAPAETEASDASSELSRDRVRPSPPPP